MPMLREVKLILCTLRLFAEIADTPTPELSIQLRKAPR